MIDKHALLKRLSRKQQKLVKKPWITKGILTSIRKKNSIFRTLFINGSDAEKIYFRTYSNKLTKIKTLSKKLYFQNELKKIKIMPVKLGILLNLHYQLLQIDN